MARCELRLTGKEGTGFCALLPGDAGELVIGELETAWAAGAVLGEAEGFAPHPAPACARTGARLFLMRGTLAHRERPWRGAAARLSIRRISLFAWMSSDHLEGSANGSGDAGEADDPTWGIAAGAGPVGLLLKRGERAAGGGWWWSLAWRRETSRSPTAREQGPPVSSPRASLPEAARSADPEGEWMDRPPAGRSILILEAAGPLGRSRAAGRAEGLSTGGASPLPLVVAGFWSAPLLQRFGSLEGTFFLRDEGFSWVREISEGWRLDWDLPVLRGVLPTLSLRLRRMDGERPVASLERARRLALSAEPWSGGRLRLAFGSAETEECRALPDASDRRSILRSTRSLFDLDARVALGGRETLALRFRESRASLAETASDVPLGMPGHQEEWEQENAAEAGSRWWDRGEGSLIRLSLQQESRGPHWLGGAVAAVPGDAGLPGFVPVRCPVGSARWRSLAGGSWLAEFWIGWMMHGWRCEGVVRAGRRTEGEMNAVLLIGARREWTGG
ncbi:MAG: hypothetical protein V1774_05455 [Candidatus Eisenbacteria bacterium]